jgi:ubiquinone/menaquinone biosynthesis C-methylase UbiE
MKKLRAFAGKLKRNLFKTNNEKEIVAFKKNIWQTDEISQAFINGSDATSVTIADIMDRQVNVFFLKNCEQSDKVLDIGCGHGIVSEFLAAHNINVTAIDISEKLLDQFKNRIAGKNLPITIMQGDAYKVPCADNSFNKVVARMFLPHFPDWPKVLKEMTRVTKPGGQILVHFPSKENTVLAKRLGIQDCNFESNSLTQDPWIYYAETDQKELSKVSHSLGLKLVSRTPLCFFASNRIIGHQIGQKLYDQYQQELFEKLKDDKVKDFVIWFDNLFTANASPDFSRNCIITFEKK